MVYSQFKSAGAAIKQKVNVMGKSIRAYEVIEVQPNGHEIVKSSWNPAEKDFAYCQCSDFNKEGNTHGVEYFVKVKQFA